MSSFLLFSLSRLSLSSPLPQRLSGQTRVVAEPRSFASLSLTKMSLKVLVLLGCLAAVLAQGPGPGPQPGPGCSMAMDKKACGKEKGCLWCEGSFGPASCYDEAQAKFLPKQFYKCKKPKKSVAAEPNPGPGPGPEPGAGCSMAMDKKACGKEKGCLWCEGGFGPGSCYDEGQAKFLPKQFYKCKKPKSVMTS